MAEQMPIELPSRPQRERTPTTVSLGDLADKILHHIKDEYSSEAINRLAAHYSRNPFRINIDDDADDHDDDANDDLMTLQKWNKMPTPGVSLFNRGVKLAIEEWGKDVTKNQIILTLCNLIPRFFIDNDSSNGENAIRKRLYACQLCKEAWDEYQQQRVLPQDEDWINRLFEEGRGGKMRRRSGLKSHRRTRTRHKFNKKTKQKKRKQKTTKRKKMRRRK